MPTLTKVKAASAVAAELDNVAGSPNNSLHQHQLSHFHDLVDTAIAAEEDAKREEGRRGDEGNPNPYQPNFMSTLTHGDIENSDAMGTDGPRRGARNRKKTRRGRQFCDAVSSSSLTVNWEDRLNDLAVYKQSNGDCNVPQRQGELGVWANRQRQAYNEGNLSQERITQLQGIGFKWTILWEDSFNKLAGYKQRNGDCNVNAHKGGKLGAWVSRQRHYYKKGKISQERVALLEGIGFIWTILANAPWEDRFNELAAYKQRNGDCIVSTKRMIHWQYGCKHNVKTIEMEVYYKNVSHNLRELISNGPSGSSA